MTARLPLAFADPRAVVSCFDDGESDHTLTGLCCVDACVGSCHTGSGTSKRARGCAQGAAAVEFNSARRRAGKYCLGCRAVLRLLSL